jgi:uncharacterized protein YciI
MAYYAAVLEMKDASRNMTIRPQHLAYLKQCYDEGKLYACGPFVDGSGGMVIYIADSQEEAEQIAGKDPYVIEGVRSLNLREWKMSLSL